MTKYPEADAKRILNEVAEHVNVSPELIRSGENLKSGSVSQARRLFAYRMRKELGWSYEQIGFFLERNHTSVMYMVNRVERNLSPEFKEEISAYHILD